MSELIPIPVPQINPNDEHAVVVRWHVEKGARVRAGQTLVTLETTKTAFDVDAPVDGYAFFEHEPNAELAVGSPVAWISDTAEIKSIPARAQPATEQPPVASSARFTRKALKLMKERGLTTADFPGDERVDSEAVERIGRGHVAQTALDVEAVNLSPSKMTEIKILRRVHEQVVPSTVSVALRCDRLEERLRELVAENGPVSLLELSIHEAAHLLPEWPELNGFYADGRAWRYRTSSIGFAVNLGRGLKVPVVRDAGALSVRDVARAVRDLSLRYMRDELVIDDVTNATFTITDLSGEGVVHFVPVLNDRQSAILGLTAARSDSRTRDLVLTFDHRLSDGMGAARFLAALRDRLEGVQE